MHSVLAVLTIDQIFGGGLTGHIIMAALTVGCGVVMLACGQTTLAWKCANLVEMLLEAGSGASALAGATSSSSAPVLSTSSSPLTSGKLTAPVTEPSSNPGSVQGADVPQVIQPAPEEDQEGKP